MNRLPLNPSFYQTYNYATNSTVIDRGAMLRDEFRRQQMDRQDAAQHYTGPKAKVVYEYGKAEFGGYRSSCHREVVEVIEPENAKIRTYGTQFSSAKASLNGRTYTLPPVSEQHDIYERTLAEQALHFSGLGFTDAMATSIENGQVRTDKHIRAEFAQYKEAKKNYSIKDRLKGKPAPRRPEKGRVTTEETYAFFNDRLAEARVPLKFDWRRHEGRAMGFLVFLSPSTEGGNGQQSLEQWAAKEWAGKPYRPWTNEIIDLPDSWFQR